MFPALPASLLSLRPGFAIREIWYLSVVTVTVQAVVNLALLSRQFRRKLIFEASPVLTPAVGPEL